MGGACRLSVSLSDAADPDPTAVSSAALDATFSSEPSPDTSSPPRSALPVNRPIADPGQQQIEVDYVGRQPAVLEAGGDWTIRTVARPASGCAGHLQRAAASRLSRWMLPAADPRVADARPSTTGVSYRYLGQTFTVDAGLPTGVPARRDRRDHHARATVRPRRPPLPSDFHHAWTHHAPTHRRSHHRVRGTTGGVGGSAGRRPLRRPPRRPAGPHGSAVDAGRRRPGLGPGAVRRSERRRRSDGPPEDSR